MICSESRKYKQHDPKSSSFVDHTFPFEDERIIHKKFLKFGVAKKEGTSFSILVRLGTCIPDSVNSLSRAIEETQELLDSDEHVTAPEKVTFVILM